MNYIDKSIAMKYLMGNEKIFVKIKDSFLASNSNFMDRYFQLLESKNVDEAYLYVHSIKGISLNLGAYVLYDACENFLKELKKELWRKDLLDDFFQVLSFTYKELKLL